MAIDLEKKIIKKAIKGDTQAFEKLIIQYEKKVYNICFHMFKNEHDSYDVSQEVFIKVYQSLDKFDFKSSFSTWIHRIAVNACIDEIRKRKRKESKTESIDNTYDNESHTIQKQYVDKTLTPEENVLKKERINDIKQALDQLKEDHRMIIILRDVKGYSYEEISNSLDCSLGTVKSRIARARSNLKEIIKANMEQK